MRRRVFAVLLLACVGVLPAVARRGAKVYHNKETNAEMSGMNRIFLGWIDMKEDAWALYGYSSKEEWASAVIGLNNELLGLCRAKFLGGKTVDGARTRGDENAAGYDLYIKLSDVLIDYNNYLLYLSIHFIDPRTNAEIGSIPARPYFGNAWGFANYLKAALDQAGQKIKVEVTQLPSKKKGK
jgi:hypothetical protein